MKKILMIQLALAGCQNFLLNSDHLILIDTTPEVVATYKRLAAGINNLDPNSNDELDQTAYLDGDGHKTSTVTGGQFTIALTGHRKYDDDAQNYIMALQTSFGCARETNCQFVRPDGSKVEGPITLANITGGSGDAGAKGDIGFEIHFNGKPSLTPVSSAGDLAAVIAGGTASGSTSATATPGATNSLSYKLYETEPTAPNLNTKFEGIAYTSGEDILSVTAGQWLLVVETNEYDRVVKVTKHELQAGDITV